MNWLQILGPTLLMIAGGIITWLFKSRVEELRATEEKLRDQQRKIYLEILDPYIRLFAELKTKGSSVQALRKMISYEL